MILFVVVIVVDVVMRAVAVVVDELEEKGGNGDDLEASFGNSLVKVVTVSLASAASPLSALT